MEYAPRLKSVNSLTRLGLPVLAVMALAFGIYLAGQTPHDLAVDAQETRALPTMTTPIGATFVLIPTGTFQMGGGVELASSVRAQTEPVHTVSVRAFWLATTEVTQAQWHAVMGYNKSQFKDPRRPADQVSFLEAQDFIRRLNQIEKTTVYRLPSEAEWEYAARAGSGLVTSEALAGVAWYGHSGNVGSRPVAGRRANAWGLYDMLGNVWEWTEDCWHDNYQGAPAEARPWQAAGDCRLRVVRGGGWNTGAMFFGETARGSYAVDLEEVTNGFRLARTVTKE